MKIDLTKPIRKKTNQPDTYFEAKYGGELEAGLHMVAYRPVGLRSSQYGGGFWNGSWMMDICDTETLQKAYENVPPPVPKFDRTKPARTKGTHLVLLRLGTIEHSETKELHLLFYIERPNGSIRLRCYPENKVDQYLENYEEEPSMPAECFQAAWLEVEKALKKHIADPTQNEKYRDFCRIHLSDMNKVLSRQ